MECFCICLLTTIVLTPPGDALAFTISRKMSLQQFISFMFYSSNATPEQKNNKEDKYKKKNKQKNNDNKKMN